MNRDQYREILTEGVVVRHPNDVVSWVITAVEHLGIPLNQIRVLQGTGEEGQPAQVVPIVEASTEEFNIAAIVVGQGGGPVHDGSVFATIFLPDGRTQETKFCGIDNFLPKQIRILE